MSFEKGFYPMGIYPFLFNFTHSFEREVPSVYSTKIRHRILIFVSQLGYNIPMAKTAMIRARTEPDLKAEVDSIFQELGLSASEAINLFYYQVKLRRGLPFDIKLPNKRTLETFEKTDEGKELNVYESIDDFFDKIEADDQV
jgi:DNA-damage-inducible protein J